MTASTQPEVQARWLRFAVHALMLIVLATGLRIWVMERSFPVKPLGDEVYYVLVAANIAEGRGHVYGEATRALRPPAHAWLLSHFADPETLVTRSPSGGLGVRTDQLRPLLRVEVALGAALVLATLLLAGALFDARTGLVAGALAAFYPTFIGYSHSLWSETLFATLVTTALAVGILADRRSSTALALLAGGVFGAAALTREIALPVAAAVVVWTVVSAASGERRAAVLRGVALLGAATLFVLPWVVRNYHEVGRVLPISSVGWIAIGEGNSLEGARWLRPAAPGRTAFRNEVLAIQGEGERADYARQRTLEVIAAQQPGWIFRKLAHNVPLMLSPDAFHLYKLRSGSYGEVSTARRRAVTTATALSFVLVSALAAFGIAGARSGDRRSLVLLVLGAVLAVHVFANANSRFRMPWMPLLMAFAAHALLGGRALLAELPRRDTLAALTAALAVAAVSASYYGLDPS